MTIVEKNLHFEMREDLGIERLGDELLVLDKANEKIHRLNRAAAMVWDGLTAGKSQEQIAGDFVEIFDISEAVAQQDVDRAAAQLVSLCLIRSIPCWKADKE